MIISSSKKSKPKQSKRANHSMNSSRTPLLNEFKESLEALLEINNRNLVIQGFWSLQIGNTVRQKPRRVLKKKEKLKVLLVKL